MGSIGAYIVDINKLLFGTLSDSLALVGSAELGTSIYGSVQAAYIDSGLQGSLRG